MFLPLHVPEVVHFVVSCTGCVSIVPHDFVCKHDACESCGDTSARKYRVVLIRSGVDRPTRWQQVADMSLGIPQRMRDYCDKMLAWCPVWVVPIDFDVEDIDERWGVECL